MVLTEDDDKTSQRARQMADSAQRVWGDCKARVLSVNVNGTCD